jgi:transposase-like protein
MSTTKTIHRVASDVKEQIIKRIKEDGLSVTQVSQEHGVSTQTVYAWLAKKAIGNPSWQEVTKLKKENRELLAIVGELTVKLSQSQKKN